MLEKPTDNSAAKPWIALFDLDGTLTWHDTLLPFLLGFVRRRPYRVLRFWKLPLALFRYWQDRDRGTLKSSVIRMLMRGETRAVLDAWAQNFVAQLESRAAISASALWPSSRRIALPGIIWCCCRQARIFMFRGSAGMLGFERTLCTEIEWQGERLDGRLKTPNRRGEEKLHCLDRLREQYPGSPVIAYGNSASDLDHLRRADRALLVNGNNAARRLAAKWNIAVSYWS